MFDLAAAVQICFELMDGVQGVSEAGVYHHEAKQPGVSVSPWPGVVTDCLICCSQSASAYISKATQSIVHVLDVGLKISITH